MRIPCAARSSPLSRAQVKEIERLIQTVHPEMCFEMQWVHTTGDRDLTTSLRELERTDFFTKEIDQLLLEGKCRLAVHSAKDLPEPLPQGLALIALTQGVDDADVLVLREQDTLTSLPSGARIGTSSARRDKQVRQLCQGIEIIDIRGPIDARLALLDAGHVDGIVMAEAALIRLGLTHRNRIRLPGPIAKHQGRLAVIARADDAEMAKFLYFLNS